MKKILPSILSADFANLERDIKELESIGVDYVSHRCNWMETLFQIFHLDSQ